MAVFQRLQLSGIGVTAPILLPMKQQIYTGAGISLLMNFSGSTPPAIATATVQVSNDPLCNTTPLLARWNPHDIMNGINTDKNNSIVYPVYAIRLQITAYTQGTVTLDVGIFDYQL